MYRSINISDQDFHNRITGRYKKVMRNPYDFPLLIFFKNSRQLLSQKINSNIFFNINKNIITQHILKSVGGIKSLISWFRIERYIPELHTFSSPSFGSRDIPVFTSFDFKKIISSINRMIYPLFFNSEKSYLKEKSYYDSPLQKFNQGQQFNHVNQFDQIKKENLINRDENISLADNSVSWDYKFVFHNESPVILTHVNLILRNSNLANSRKYLEVLNEIKKSNINKSNAYFSNYIQIINHGLHTGFEPAILQHVNLLLNSMSIQGESSTSKEFFNTSKLDNKYHVILPHVNLLLNTISANNILSYTQEFSKGHGSYFKSGDRLDYSFPQSDLIIQELAKTNETHLKNVQVRNHHNFPAVLQHVNIIQRNIHEMILPNSKSFQESIQNNHKKEYKMTLSYLMPSIIKPLLKKDIQGQSLANLEPIKKLETSTVNPDLHFKTSRNLEEEIETVKKIASEAKQTMIESVKNIQISHEEEMNRKININQLSDQVYRLLGQKITIEKERRGYI